MGVRTSATWRKHEYEFMEDKPFRLPFLKSLAGDNKPQPNFSHEELRYYLEVTSGHKRSAILKEDEALF
jgi:hypothetical protein